MPQPDDLFVQRTTDLDIDVKELWTLISTADGWRDWLVDEADVTIATDSSGIVVDDQVERLVHIGTITDGRRINFSWCEVGEPSTTSYVQLEIVELPAGRSRLNITERFASTTTAATMSAAVTTTWDVRLISLWLLALPFHVMA
jgi:hypothetical protein